nr:phosphoribosylformylglycinamidine cyclo-ligase [Alphaproteobacteria bacterium]
VKGLAHITGGGITDNLPRCLPEGLDGEVNLGAITVLPVFQWLAKEAGIAESEMLRTFNCGIGMVAVADEAHADAVIAAFQQNGDIATRIGKLIHSSGEAKTVYRGSLNL